MRRMAFVNDANAAAYTVKYIGKQQQAQHTLAGWRDRGACRVGPWPSCSCGSVFQAISARFPAPSPAVHPSHASHAEPALTQSFPGFTKQEPQGKRLLEMVVPPALAPSLAADLVECKYWLEVRLPGICYTGASW